MRLHEMFGFWSEEQKAEKREKVAAQQRKDRRRELRAQIIALKTQQEEIERHMRMDPGAADMDLLRRLGSQITDLEGELFGLREPEGG